MSLIPGGTPPTPNATTSKLGKIMLSGDLAGTANSPTVAKVNGITVTGTPAVGQVLTATSPTAADWATPAGGSQTPWTSNINAAGYNLNSLHHLGVNGGTQPTVVQNATFSGFSFVPVGDMAGAIGFTLSANTPALTQLCTITLGTVLTTPSAALYVQGIGIYPSLGGANDSGLGLRWLWRGSC